MVELHITSGIQGSGKTVLAQALAIEKKANLYIYDLIAAEHVLPPLYKSIYKLIKIKLLNGENAIYDNMNLTITDRLELLEYFKNIDCKKILHVMNTPIEICLDRHHKRAGGRPCLPDRFIYLCAKKYEPPTLEEGWDEIIYHEYQKEALSYGY